MAPLFRHKNQSPKRESFFEMSSILNCVKQFFRINSRKSQRSQDSGLELEDDKEIAQPTVFSRQITPPMAPKNGTYEDLNKGGSVVKDAAIDKPVVGKPVVGKPVTEQSVAEGQLPTEEQSSSSERQVDVKPPLLPTISVRRPTLTPEDTKEVHRSTSANSLTKPDSSQSSQLSRSDSKASSITEQHWLREQLEAARIECPEHAHSFLVPRSVQEELIIMTNVSRDIQERNPDIEEHKVVAHANTTCQYARRLYATLAYIKKGAEIGALLDEGITDEDLPLVRTPNMRSRFALCRQNGETIRALGGWKDKYLENFDRVQWWMIAPVFKLDEELYDLDDKAILPFIPFKTTADAEGRKQGGYSEVYPVCIHPAHHEFWEASGSLDAERLVAVKKLYSEDEKEFQKERTILTAVGPKNHPHLIKLLATYKKGSKYHLMFPFANSNLRKYWDDRPNPGFDKKTVLWSLQQMTGIASGLFLLHNLRVTYPLHVVGAGNVRVQKDGNLSVQRGEEWFGRHGDIKPENVLWFAHDQETGDSMGILQIADFGLGRFHGRDSRSGVNPDTVFSSPTYEPPECKLRQPVSRAYDIWSLGCLFLEFITWLLKGSLEIEGFSEARGRQATATGINDDNFFTIVTDAEGMRATVREQVLVWKDHLHAHEKCSQLIHDILDLTMKEMLRIESKNRCKASWLYQQLNMYLKQAENDEDYLLKPVPRKRESEHERERTNSTPAYLGGPTVNPKRLSVTFWDESKTALIKAQADKLQAHHPRDLVRRAMNTPGLLKAKGRSPNPTWPIDTRKIQR